MTSNHRFLPYAFTAAAALGLGGGCGNPAAELRFISNNNVLLAKSTIAAATFSSVDLAPMPTTSLPHFADFYVPNESLAPVNNAGLPGRQVEAHLYAADLEATNGTLRQVAAGDQFSWDAATNLSVLPLDVAMLYPPNPSFNTQNRYSIFAVPAYFWQNAPPASPADAPTGSGSIKSARIYHGGLCSSEQAYSSVNNDGMFDRLSDGLWTAFKDSIKQKAPAGTWVTGFERNFSRITASLGQGLVPTGSPRGGFFLNLWFQAHLGVAIPPFGATPVLTANYEYEFGLDDGRLMVTPSQNELLVAPQNSYLSFKAALEQTLPQALRDVAISAQQAPIPLGFCNAPNDPSAGIAVLSGYAKEGAKKLGLSPADVTRVETAAKDASFYTCNGPNARFILKAKRFNPRADSIELVWFDKQDPDDPMFAFYAALIELGSNTGAPLWKQLCGRDRISVGDGGSAVMAKPFVTVARGPLSE
jgi:hypothetical protein